MVVEVLPDPVGVDLNRSLCCAGPRRAPEAPEAQPAGSAIVDRCIECGFCESNCPSRDITLTPRQRITT